jgi:hypothetical protein
MSLRPKFLRSHSDRGGEKPIYVRLLALVAEEDFRNGDSVIASIPEAGGTVNVLLVHFDPDQSCVLTLS